MPRFFFHLINDLDVPDDEGTELADLNAARERAVLFARDMAGNSILEHGKLDLRHRIDVEDQSGEVVHTVKFGDAFKVLS